MDNPFSSSSKTRKEKKLIPAGIYPSTLTEVKVVQVTHKETGEKRPKLLFNFFVAEEDAEVGAWFWPSLSEKSHLVQFLRVVGGDDFTPGIQSSRDSMWDYVQGLAGADYNIVVTNSNGYNNIASAVPVKVKGAPVVKQQSVAITVDDDIPF
jgi:hypothetical protein